MTTKLLEAENATLRADLARLTEERDRAEKAWRMAETARDAAEATVRALREERDSLSLDYSNLVAESNVYEIRADAAEATVLALEQTVRDMRQTSRILDADELEAILYPPLPPEVAK